MWFRCDLLSSYYSILRFTSSAFAEVVHVVSYESVVQIDKLGGHATIHSSKYVLGDDEMCGLFSLSRLHLLSK